MNLSILLIVLLYICKTIVNDYAFVKTIVYELLCKKYNC